MSRWRYLFNGGLMHKWWIWKLKIRLFLMGLGDDIANGFWLTAGDALWLSADWRDRYYLYRESCWRRACEPLPFAGWLRSEWRRND